jgi:SAM-dependent methyltransferase
MLTNEKIDSFYRNNLKEHGSGSKGVGWKDDAAQKIRFDQLIKIFEDTLPFTLNDLGCGVGDLWGYLNQRGFQLSAYNGYDILDEMITLANKNHDKIPNVKFEKIKHNEEMRLADYTVSSGIFNPRFGESDEVWKNHIISTLDVMNKRSRRGFSFNALTIYSDKELMKPELFYTDPLWLFDYCKRNFSRNVALLHDYEIYDFTILVRKK